MGRSKEDLLLLYIKRDKVKFNNIYVGFTLHMIIVILLMEESWWPR
jgi:hypothetical protein